MLDESANSYEEQVVIETETKPILSCAPESLASDRSLYSYKTDVFMLGCTMWEMFTRKEPFHWLAWEGEEKERRRRTPSEIVRLRKELNPTEMATVLSFLSHLSDDIQIAVPRTALVLMLKCLIDLPERRPTVSQIEAELQGIFDELSSYGYPQDLMPLLPGSPPTFMDLFSLPALSLPQPVRAVSPVSTT